VCRPRHARDVPLCETAFSTPQNGAPARGCAGIRGQGVAIWNLEKLFSPEGRRHLAGGLFAWPQISRPKAYAARSPAKELRSRPENYGGRTNYLVHGLRISHAQEKRTRNNSATSPISAAAITIISCLSNRSAAMSELAVFHSRIANGLSQMV